MKRSIELACAWSGVAMMVLLSIGLFGCGIFPPISPNDSPQEVADFYRDNTDLIRAGLLFSFIAFALWGPFMAAVGTQLRRIPDVSPSLVRTQQLAAAASWIFLLLPMMFYSAAAFRPDSDPDVIRAINDIAWFSFIMPFVPFVTIAFVMAVAILQDPGPEPIFPRWFGYLCLWIALLQIPGGLLTFFHTGPFDWRGLFALWIPFTAFGTWMATTSWTLDRAIRRQTSEPRAEGSGRIPDRQSLTGANS
jgi:hypothetical protein